jgi:hypothetical protein
MNNIVFVLILLGFIAIIISLDIWVNNCVKEEFDQCYNQAPSDAQMLAMGTSAKDACNKISSKAEEIKAHYDGASGVANAIMGPLSPANYKSGDNTSSDIMRNIINTNLSSCDITKISNDCVNSSGSIQSNEIDNSLCDYCKTNLCEVKNIDQANIMRISQLCTMQSAIETLLKKKSSIDAQALAVVLQEAQGILSGSNTVQKENCNVINNDLSTASYLENKATCANTLSLNQKNSLKFCGNATDIVQKNQFDALQKCIIASNYSSNANLEGDTGTLQQSDTSQKTSGLTIACSAISGIIIGVCVIASIYKGYQTYQEKKSTTNTYKE